jgi:Skp family chaperone for outer membrane proteins
MTEDKAGESKDRNSEQAKGTKKKGSDEDTGRQARKKPSDATRKRTHWYDIVLLAVMLLFVGMGAFFVARPRPRTGVVDVERIAQETGIERRMMLARAQWEQGARVQYEAVEEDFQAKLEVLTEKLEATDDDEEKARLGSERMLEQAMRKRALESIQQEWLNYRGEMQIAFREKLDKLVAAVAEDEKMDVVLAGGELGLVLFIKDKQDITDMVLAAAEEEDTFDDLFRETEMAPTSTNMWMLPPGLAPTQ